jgi:hypothetical protein
MRNTADVTGGKPIAVLLQFISGVSVINPLVAFYDIHGGKREVLFFYFVLDTTRDYHNASNGLTALTPEMACNQMAMGLPLVMPAVFLTAKSFW